ncbi:transglycosylase SLT domain-containing protein [Kingella denitrificans]|uniref:transglycosylase SLT domain-containing protein n=1 Tax=Kingella denitrificans TaxID=502 RepID=UPI0028D76EC5|nr:transglycosylase SLT domain-containing protein [Kingella denitrificans]
MATVIDTLFMELGIDSSKFSREAKQAVSKLDDMTEAFEKAEAKTGKSGKGLDKHAEKVKQNVKQAKNLTEAMGKVAKGAAALFALVTGSNALDKLIREAAEANVQLDNLSRNIGMSRNQLQAWGGMAEMAGGSAEGMKGSLAGLSMGITRLTTMGDTSMVPFFNAFGVALLNTDGKARDLDSIMLDLSDRFSKMDRVQAYNLAKSMGLDDGTINTLMLGRAEMEKMLEMQRNLYHSGEKEIAVSRELTRSRAYLNQQWDALKNMLADALAPHLLRLVKLVSSFADYLMRNENTMKHVFEGVAFVLGAVLIPVLWSAVTALYAFIAPFALAAAAVAALGAAFVLLYDDYKTWAEGGKSLFDWGAFTGYIRTSKVSVDSLNSAFAYLVTGYKSWAEAGNSAFDWLRLKGFIDENGVSLRSLANGFKSLANDIYQFFAPALSDVGEILTSLMNGNFNGAWTAAKRLAMRPVNFVADQVQNVVERVSGAADVATNHTPGAEGSAQAAARNATRSVRGALFGSGQTRGAPKGQYTASNLRRHNQQIIAEEARKAGIDPSIMLAMAHIETGGSFDERAKNPGSSASGLFQFMKGTRGRYGLDGNTVFDARKNAAAGARMLNENRAFFRKRFGREPSAGELYLMHQQGAGGASALLSNPNALAIDVLTRAHNGNRRLAAEIIRKNGGRMDMTAGQFSSRWINKGDALQMAYGGYANRPIGGRAVAAGANRGLQSSRRGEEVRASQSNVINSQNMHVAINGGIHVQSSASTIDGTMEDAASAARNRMIQVVPAMV